MIIQLNSSRNIIQTKLKDKFDKLILNDKNFGKGYSIRKGIEAASEEVLIIQDADKNMIQKIIKTFRTTSLVWQM